MDGVLEMSRAFGDGRLKEHITAEPDVMVQNITGDTEFIILASDGLWKVIFCVRIFSYKELKPYLL